jgi:protocatechuate 3,4-dioxygenase beta subunit
MSRTLRPALTFLLAVSAAVLGASGVAVSARQDLSAFMNSAPACLPDATPTPAVAPDGTFKDGAPLRPVLAGPAMAGTRLALSGTVSGIRCGRIAGARVDLWQPDIRGVYDMAGFGLRGYQLTDGQGAYRFDTIVPGAPNGRAKHLSLRVRAKGHPDFFTEIYFPDDPANARDRRFRKELLLQPKQGSGGQQRGVFDVLLDM